MRPSADSAARDAAGDCSVAPRSHVRSIEEAAAYIARSGQDVGILVDLLHLAQSGGTPADIARLDPALIVCAQFCDGPQSPDDEQYYYNALYDRQVPGDGQLPVREFLRALPDHVVDRLRTKPFREGHVHFPGGGEEVLGLVHAGIISRRAASMPIARITSWRARPRGRRRPWAA